MKPQSDARGHYAIRDAVSTDAEEIIRMHAQSWLDTYPDDQAGVSREWVAKRVARWSSEDGVERRRRRIQEARQNPDMLYKVAVDDTGKIIGIACPIRDRDSQRVGGLYVDKEYYGRGLAQQLMDQIIAWADPTRPIELEVAAYNKRAKRFYEKYGFREIPGSGAKHGHMIPTIMMKRTGDKQ